ncbi:MAG: hypothetical protein PHI18_01465 [bacterium]|nr:hypothetical protein [bacterium]
MDDLRLNRKDLRFIVVCLALLLGGLLVSVRYFHRAFPEASIDFRLNRPQSQRVAADFLRSLDLSPPADYRHAARFGYDGTAKTYLEKELGVAARRSIWARPSVSGTGSIAGSSRARKKSIASSCRRKAASCG